MKKPGLRKEKTLFCPLPPKGGFIKSPLGDLEANEEKNFLQTNEK